MRNTYLVCYDICEDKRLRKVFTTMRDFGDHLLRAGWTICKNRLSRHMKRTGNLFDAIVDRENLRLAFYQPQLALPSAGRWP